MRSASIAVLFVVLAAPLSAKAEDVVSEKLKFRIGVPDGFEIRGTEEPGEGVWHKGWTDILVEIRTSDDSIAGMVFAVKSDMSPKDRADEREGVLKKNCKSCERVSDAKVDRAGGAWWRRDFRVTNDYGEWRHVHVFCQSNGYTFELSIWCAEKSCGTCGDRIEKVVASMAAGEGLKAGGDAAKPGDATPAGPVTKLKMSENQWKGFGIGTTVKYKMVSEAAGTKTDMSMTYVLVKQGDKAWTIRTTTEIPAYNMKNDATTEYELEAAKDGQTDSKAKVEKGEEKIKVPAGEFDCQWVKTTMDAGWSKVWLSDKVPGKIVKSESDMSGAKSLMELTELQAK